MKAPRFRDSVGDWVGVYREELSRQYCKVIGLVWAQRVSEVAVGMKKMARKGNRGSIAVGNWVRSCWKKYKKWLKVCFSKAEC